MRKLHNHQGMKPTINQLSTEVRIPNFEVHLMVNSQPEEVDNVMKKGETPSESTWGEIRGIPQ